jgi:Protein of unknown function (DUF3592)
VGRVVVLCGLSVHHVETMQDASDSVGWPRAPARILQSEVVTPTRTIGSSKKPPSPYTRLQYEYTYEGVTYPGWRVNVMGHSVGAWAATEYPVGATPDVWVNPGHPEFAALEPGLNPVEPIVFLLVLGVSIASGIWFVRRMLAVYAQRWILE